MKRNLKNQNINNFSTSSSTLLSTKHIFFNSNFVTPDSDSSAPTSSSTARNPEAKKHNHQFQIKLINSLEEEMSDESENIELSLAEIGYNSVEIEDWDQIVQPKKPDLMELIFEMITTYKKPDVRIIIDKTTFNCHKIVLQVYSKFFMDYEQENDESIVVLPEDKVSPAAFIMVYKWMLSKEPKVHREGILELFNAASFLKIQALLDQCWVCLDDDERFSEDAAFLMYLEARKYKHELIQQLMLTRICKFFLTLVASKEFLEMNISEVCTLFKSNSIGVYSEAEVLMSAVRWLNFNFPQRERYVLEVVKCIRFGLMAPWQLVELRRHTSSPEIRRVVEHSVVRSMIDDGLSYVTTKHYYSNNEQDYLSVLERLQLSEPVDRQWMRDRTWETYDKCPNKNIVTYQMFLEYLEYILKSGKNHWKTLELNEDGPYKDYYFDVRNGDNNYLDEFCKSKNIRNK